MTVQRSRRITARARITGRWRIVQMALWDQDVVDLVQPGYIVFAGSSDGQFGFAVVEGWMDCAHSDLDGRAHVAFSWDGSDEGDAVCGRGWATQHEDGTLEGELCFHLGDSSGFVAHRDE